MCRSDTRKPSSREKRNRYPSEPLTRRERIVNLLLILSVLVAAYAGTFWLLTH